MAAIGGDIEIGVTHETVGNFTLFCKSAEDHTLDPGGYRNTDDKNLIDSGGNMIMIKNRGRWEVEATATNDMNTRKDMDKVAAVAASPIEADFTFNYLASGITLGARGTFVGDINPNGNTTDMQLKMAGGGTLKEI